MSTNSNAQSNGEPPRLRNAPPRALYWMAVCVFLVFGGYYLWTQHRAHVLQYWPLALFLICPFMHLFGGHGGCCGGEKHQKDKDGKAGCHHA